MSTATHNDDEYLDDLVAYALDALDDDEHAALTAHLATCLECRRTLAEFQATASLLPYGLPEIQPTSDLRGAILARVRGVAPAPAQPARVLRPHWWQRRTPAWATGLAAAVALLALLWAGQLQAEVAGLQQQVSVSQQQLDVARRQLEQRTRLVALLRSNFTTTELVSNGGTGRSARLYRSGDQALLVASLPPLPADRIYQAWLIQGGTPHNAGLLSSDSTLLAIDDLAALGQASTIAITEEPRGGSPGPTTPVLLAGELRT